MSGAQRARAFGAAIGRLLNPADRLHQRLLAETTTMAPETMRVGLARSLGGWTPRAMIALLHADRERLATALPPRQVAVILAGSLPPSHVQAVAYPYLLGASVFVKPPSADPVFPQLLAEATDGELTLIDRPWLDRRLHEMDAVVAVGDDETVREIRSRLPVSTPCLAFGHKTALGLVIGASAARARTVADAIAVDVGTFDQRGCLSPREVLVVGGMPAALTLAQGVAERLRDLPRRADLGPTLEGALRMYAERAALLGVEAYGVDDLQWGVALHRGGRWAGTPGGRHVVVRAIPSLGDLPDALAPLGGFLSSVGVAGSGLSSRTRRAIARLGASRIVGAGRLQAAPPTWPHDGTLPLLSLCRWCGDT